MTSSRERILDAYEDLLAREGERHATLDAVAALADVSKGGLLYHFPSKDRLAEALCDRLRDLADEDAGRMINAPEGAARYYVRTSRFEGTPLDRVLVAVARLRQAGDARARSILESVSDRWLRILQEALGDLDVARVVKLVGDGRYYTALNRALGGEPEAAEDDALLDVIDRITMLAKPPTAE